jgi:hypothetical protein
MTSVLSFVSFSCACGCEIHLPEHPNDAAEIMCVACGEWIGLYAELIPARKNRPTIARAKSTPKSRKQKSPVAKSKRRKRR